MTDSRGPGLLADRRRLAERLLQKGLSPPATEQKVDLFAKATAALRGLGPGPDAERTAHYVPGRIEVLGKHTDYAGGSSMVVAAERGFCLVVRPRDDDQLIVTDALSGETVGARLDPDLVPPSGHWSNYPMTVARRVARNFPGDLRGADIALASDLPPAAGMSSSSAMIAAVFGALSLVNKLYDREEYRESIRARGFDLAGYLATIENGQSFRSLEGDRGVGTFGGSEDHTAILLAQPHRIEQFRYCPLAHEREFPVPPDHLFAVGLSGVVAEKTGAAREKYNAASRLASAVAELWRCETGRDDPHLAAALRSSPDAAGRLREVVEAIRLEEFEPAALSARLEHFIVENEELIPAAGDALAHGDLGRFAHLVARSQQAAEQLLGNQVPQTIYLAAVARESGARAASAFGAGFGGSVWAMVEAAKADSFLTAWAGAYRQQFPGDAESSAFFLTGAGPAAFQVC